MIKPSQLLLIVFILATKTSGAQPNPVMWTFNATHTSRAEITIELRAQLLPGWHIYSQNLGEGGPVPTRITFEKQEAMLFLGTPIEKGNAITFYQDLYDMEITWFSDSIVFMQKAKLMNHVLAIQGTIEYMACSNHLCIPDKINFTIPIPSE